MSPQGHREPTQELLATIAAFEQGPTAEVPLPAQCRFPARYVWLKQRLGNQVQLPSYSCRDLEVWRQQNQLQSISLIFVTGYLGNPASFFGHLLMKLNKQNETYLTDTPLLDSSVNFGANTGQQDNTIKYVSYGLLGGYSASFSQEDYYRYEHGYAENEQRELWEYELNLSAEELTLLEAHLWERKGQQYRYYFLDSNCASQMANFISIVLDEPLVDNLLPWDMPLDIFKALTKREHNGRPLVKSINKSESKYARIRDKYLALSPEEQAAAKSLTINQPFFTDSRYLNLSAGSQSRVLNLMFDYYELLMVEGDAEKASIAKQRKLQLMRARLQLPAMETAWQRSNTAPPHQAQNPLKLALSSGYSVKHGGFGQLSFRAAYYGYLSLETSRFKDSNATFFDAEVKFDAQDIWLGKLDVFNVTTLNIHQVDLFDENRFAWSTRLTVEQQNLSCRDCERVRWYGGLGKAMPLSGGVSLYALPRVNLDISNYHDSDVGVTLGALYTANPIWKTHLTVTPTSGFGPNAEQSVLVDWESRFGNSQDWDIRFNAKYHQSSEFGVSYARYF
ncbi:DUF4105 domain-containing protein [Vibrio sp. CAU 1672]|uniref:Lnb N-terminal periplasmic domain-containing protein n=1 Tax=Vibrio sp. CAU 1672 TaxID=3032594 RepID=UPI0023DBFD20|nr:DUF4105 domain-containing protein [Vibrio sp. CAU 1672]MDF2152960.1 DUF4105 domain-containing protein [Vibrio sp. CAU 1672]